jgi:hypothetical protein
MDTVEARQILREHMTKYRARSRAELLALLGSPEVTEVVGPSGVHYQIEIETFWDDVPDGNLRLLGAIDDGGLRAFVPLTEDFIVSPAGDSR